MRRVSVAFAIAAVIALALTAGGAGLGWAQPAGPAIKQSLLQHESVSGNPGKETFMLLVEFAPGATTGRHIHHGDEYATVVEGELRLDIAGQAPRTVKAGEAYHNSADIVHETRNLSSAPARILTVLVVEKGKPISEPVK